MRGLQLIETYDIAIVGSGFAGSLLAMIARRLDFSVLLLERGKHPRTVIGESSTPLSNLLLEELSTKYRLPRIAPLSKWGSWQKSYPNLACGLKRGFTFYYHEPNIEPHTVLSRQNQLLVAASPNDAIADTHWYRADFDYFLLQEAQRLGGVYLDNVKLSDFIEENDHVTLQGQRYGVSVQFQARFVVDATGPRGFLHHALKLEELKLPDMPATQAIFSHFHNVERLENISNTLETPPYPIDDAAVHHIFDGGWIWILKFNNCVTSAGASVTDEMAARLNLKEGAPAWNRLLQKLPMVQKQFASAKAILPFTHIPRLSFRSEKVAGTRWALLPSATGFVDPLLSTGFPLTLLGITRLAEILAHDWGSNRWGNSLAAYASKTDLELLSTARLIGALYANMNNFSVFTSITLLYFAAIIFSETARRLNKPHLAESFLLHDTAMFGTTSSQILTQAQTVRSPEEAAILHANILRAIEPINLAGLGEKSRQNWYPVEAEDLLRSAHKIGASYEEIQLLLQRCGFMAKAHLD
jgi:tetracycline 7-halogenase / FADH2 O2-dependent halogenase